MKCHHLNCRLTEFGTSYTLHDFDAGMLSYNDSDFGDYTGEVLVECKDCRLKRRYRVNHKSTPKWVQQLFNQVMETRQ